MPEFRMGADVELMATIWADTAEEAIAKYKQILTHHAVNGLIVALDLRTEEMQATIFWSAGGGEDNEDQGEVWVSQVRPDEEAQP